MVVQDIPQERISEPIVEPLADDAPAFETWEDVVHVRANRLPRKHLRRSSHATSRGRTLRASAATQQITDIHGVEIVIVSDTDHSPGGTSRSAQSQLFQSSDSRTNCKVGHDTPQELVRHRTVEHMVDVSVALSSSVQRTSEQTDCRVPMPQVVSGSVELELLSERIAESEFWLWADSFR